MKTLTSPNNILADCVTVLRQGIHLLERIDDELFVATTPFSPRGSIGAHIRHILDFYQLFLSGCEKHRVDYNHRNRDPRVERYRFYALGKIEQTIEQLERISLIDASHHLLVSMENSSFWCRSSVLRELDFLLSHTIHHYSLIAMIVRMHEIDPGQDFGVAPSTLEYWRQELACAQ